MEVEQTKGGLGGRHVGSILRKNGPDIVRGQEEGGIFRKRVPTARRLCKVW